MQVGPNRVKKQNSPHYSSSISPNQWKRYSEINKSNSIIFNASLSLMNYINDNEFNKELEN